VNGAETKMTVFNKGRVVRRLLAACAIATAVGGGLGLAAAPPENVRLVGVSAQATGKTAAVLIEATEPVAYAVSRPDPLTVLVDLRNVSVADVADQVTKKGPVTGIKLEQATSDDGGSVARVRVSLATPTAYKVRSSRNVIRLELEPEVARVDAPLPELASRARLAAADAKAATQTATQPATLLEKVRADHTRTSTTITLAGNGRLVPSSLTESDDQPRRLVLDFPNVSPASAGRTGIDSVFVKHVRVSLEGKDGKDGKEPLTTRVVMEISSSTAYHVERTGPDGRDLAVVFESLKPGSTIMLAPGPTTEGKDEDEKETITLAQAIANAEAMTPRDPTAALPASPASAPVVSKPAPASAPAAAPAARTTTAAPSQPPAQPTAPAQPQSTFAVPGTGPKQYVGHPINFDFEDADLRAVLRVFANESGLNMIIDPQVSGRVNVLLSDVPWDQALDQILRSNKLGYTVEGNILRIAPLGVLAEEQAAQQKLTEAKALAGELEVRTFPLSYAKGEALSPVLTKSALSPRGGLQVDTRTNTLIITDLPDRLATAQSLIALLDKPQPQVEVEARVVQTSRAFARALGIQWGFNGRANSTIGNTTGLAFPNNGAIGGRVAGPGGTVIQGPTDPRGGNASELTNTAVNLGVPANSAIGLALGSINGAFNLDVALTALETSGKGRILSSPRLTTQNNQTAEVAQGVQFPYQTTANNTTTTAFRDATLRLTVTPQITVANTVIMNIAIENSSVDRANTDLIGTPSVNTQRATTVVQVNDGATTVIGGIFISEEQSSNDRTPVLHRVPILKWLFQRNAMSDSSRELLIFVTPKILRG
jgi:type IV pilus secretin PilQ/predicted competence protein